MIKLIAVGDLILARGIKKKAKIYGWDYFFEKVKDILKSGDITFGVLDVPITNRGMPNPSKPKNTPFFRTNPEAAFALKKAGFSILCLANNHILDYGEEGLVDTIKYLEKAKISYFGAGENENEARKPTVIEKNGINVAFLGYTYTYKADKNTPGCPILEEKIIREDINNIRDKTDFIVVSFHDGIEYSDYPTPHRVKLARKAIDWGADIVLGHHPHVIQGIEKYKHGVIVHSLGNFVSDLAKLSYREEAMSKCLLAKKGGYKFNLKTDLRPLESIILKIELQKKTIPEINITPVRLDGAGRPILDDGQGIIKRLEEISGFFKNLNHPVFKELAHLEVDEQMLAVYKYRFLGNLKRLHHIRKRHLRLVVEFLRGKLCK